MISTLLLNYRFFIFLGVSFLASLLLSYSESNSAKGGKSVVTDSIKEVKSSDSNSFNADPFEQFLIVKFCDFFNSIILYLCLYFLFIYIFLSLVYSYRFFSFKNSRIVYFFLSIFNYIKNYILGLLTKNLESVKFL